MKRPKDDAATPQWAKLHLWQIQPVRDVFVFFVLLWLFWLGQAISVVTVPVLLAVLFAYLFEPVVQMIVRRGKASRQTAVVGILVAAVLLIVLPVTLGLTYGAIQAVGLASRVTGNVREVATFAQASPEEVESAREALRAAAGDGWVWIGDQVRADQDSDLSTMFDAVSSWTQSNAERLAQTAVGVGTNVFQTASSILKNTFSLAFMAFLTAFFFFFIATRWVECQEFAAKLLPDRHKARTVDLVRKFDRVISAFIRGRLTIAFIQSILFSFGYWMIGVPAAFVLGPIVAVLSIVPYLALVGVPISVALLWLESHTGLRGHILWIVGAPLGLYFLVQAVDDYVLTPMIQGKETGMSTPVILFASLAGGALFGVFGLLIAIPIAACLKIVTQEILWPRFKAWAEGRKSDFLPIDGD